MLRFRLVCVPAALALGGCFLNPYPNPYEPYVSQADAAAAKAPDLRAFRPASGGEPGYAEAEALAITTIYKREPQRGLVESKTAQVLTQHGIYFEFDIEMSGTNRYRVRIFSDMQGGMTVSEFEKTG
jgi:hypothetical protein